MRFPIRSTLDRRVIRRRVLGAVLFTGVLGIYVAVGIAPFVLPSVTDLDPGEALRNVVIVASLVYTGLLVVLAR